MRITTGHKRILCDLIRSAFVEIRFLGLKRKGKQAAELAHAFHNLPKEMWEPDFTLEEFRERLKEYHKKYPTGKTRNYIFEVNQIIAFLEDPSAN
jgi:hypothetical protein